MIFFKYKWRILWLITEEITDKKIIIQLKIKVLINSILSFLNCNNIHIFIKDVDIFWTGVWFPSPPPNLMPDLDVIEKNVDLISVIYNFIPNFKKIIYRGCHLKQMDVMHDIWSFLIKSSPNLDVNKFENDCYW